MYIAKGAEICRIIGRDEKNRGPFSQEGRQTRFSLYASSEKNQTGCESQLQSINQDTINRKNRFRALC